MTPLYEEPEPASDKDWAADRAGIVAICVLIAALLIGIGIIAAISLASSQ